uniref:desmocollin 2-like protein n=1 Tax=Semicossyphus pulcher TaxID=241346 RepID=UPI0037E7CDDD
MAKVLIFNILLALILSGVESCRVPISLQMPVSQTIQAGEHITTVVVDNCDAKSIRFTSHDSSFTIYSNGTIEASENVAVPLKGRTFFLSVENNFDLERQLEVHLYRSKMFPKKGAVQGFLRRSKRRWSPPPFNILENVKGPYPIDIEKIVSDSASTQKVYYTISGPGVDRTPVGVFSLDKYTGLLKVNQAVDREQYPKFVITTNVFNDQTGVMTDAPLDIEILVDDVNDNAPTFKDPLQFTLPEQSKAGSIVGMVNATDRDQEGTLHVKVRYSLLTGLNMFSINPVTGVITTVAGNLDREVSDKHLVTVQIKDMDGAVNGLSNTGTATITLTDINDNPPTFTKKSYAASVKENESEKLILRIPVEDKDLKDTPNWISKFVIKKGNENGNFRVDTDPKTNDGLLYVTKPLDFEKSPNVNLEIMARNVADLQGTSAQWQSVPVNVAVINIDEGPEFTAPTVRYTVKENTPNGTQIGTYKAVDPETKSSEGIKYYKLSDPASWININRDNGELTVANTIDRESQFVQNGLYNLTVKAVDASSKSGTGTVIIVVEDVNDNVPKFLPGERLLCEKEGELGSVVVVAEDNDQSPFSSPFSFSLPADNDGKWSVTKYNDTAVTLKHLKELPTGIYNVPVVVKDLQGTGETQTATVRICQCKNGRCLAKESNVSLGPLGILALLLPLALLLLLGLLLAFFCTTKRGDRGSKIEESKGHLITSNTEAPGEEVDSIKLTYPTIMQEVAVKGSVNNVNTLGAGIKGTSTIGGNSTHNMGYNTVMTSNDFYTDQYHDQFGLQYTGQATGSGLNYDGRYTAQDASLLHTWQTNGRYLQQKLPYLGMEDNGRFADDIIHSYGYEGAGSAAGSVGCCSDFGDNDNLDFLNTLGPKFKNLGEVVRKT